MNLHAGMVEYLKKPYRGYRAVRLIERTDLKWLVEICDSGLELECYEDEFE